MGKINKLLIANRGEIAMRVIRTAREMGIRIVAIYSEADLYSPHVRMADEAVAVGPPPSKDSYLNMEKIIQVAVETGADAIHPGYGFLSENATFAARVEEKGLIFIGPTSDTIAVMGNKLSAKKAASKFSVPMVPGTEEAITDLSRARSIADEIGYPVLIKAAAGGGGKGMRIVADPQNLEEQMTRAISEATSAFGDGSVFIEKYVLEPRHIEIQILADEHGNIVHLFERECSIQRRHQKVVEEAPSPLLEGETREKMGKAAVQVAQACKYRGAGTVEFLVDADQNFYFLEMNTRLQVEHPVTECITGIDLVEQQIRIAQGESLGFNQEDLSINGHAMELRVYAEDPWNDFAPSIGTLNKYEPPGGDGIRYDDGFEEGMQIPIYYDPMIGKLIVHAKDRLKAINLLLHAIQNFPIEGISTTLPFGRFVMKHEAFRKGYYNTHFVSKEFSPGKLDEEFLPDKLAVAHLALQQYLEERKKVKIPEANTSAWKKARKIW